MTRAVLSLEVQTPHSLEALKGAVKRGSALRVKTGEGWHDIGEVLQAQHNVIRTRGPHERAEPKPAPGTFGGEYVPQEGEVIPPPTHPAGIAKAQRNAAAARRASSRRKRAAGRRSRS